MHWLLNGLVPNYHSISDFRKDNPSALKKLFKVFVSFLKDADLIAGQTIAIDGTKSRAHNSKKANFNRKKIDRHLAYIDEKTQQYMDELAQNDELENCSTITDIEAKIARLKTRLRKKKGSLRTEKSDLATFVPKRRFELPHP
jgi:ribosomal protein L29